MYLDKAMVYAREHDMTHDNTGIIFRSYPENDFAIWYGLRMTALEELRTLVADTGDPQIQSIERSNGLMKLRELLLDDGEKGTHVTLPSWSGWYPNQAALLWWHIGNCIFFCFPGIVLLRRVV